MKRVVILAYTAVVLVMAAATFAEHVSGYDVYHQWWFTALWALLTAVAVAWFVERRVRRPSVVLLHLSFVVILAGALTTHLTTHPGRLHLREGQSTDVYVDEDSHRRTLPFTLQLDSFVASYHNGTRAAIDYQSHLAIGTADGTTTTVVSMNNIFSSHGMRLYQSGFDPDERGTTLSVSYDPWGVPITYIGYGLLFLSMLWVLVDPKGTYRQLLRQTRRQKTVLTVSLLMVAQIVNATPTLPQETADRLGRLNMLYADRICPVQTYAIDVTKKLCGKRSYANYTPEQVLAGLLFFPNEWDQEPLIKVKNTELRQRLGLNERSAISSFFNGTDYKLGQLLDEYYQGHHDKLHQEAAKLDEKLMIVMSLRLAQPMSIFPFEGTWYSPADDFPETMEPERRDYIRNIFQLLADDARSGNFERMNEALDKLQQYQRRYGAEAIPSDTRLKAERIYNASPFATILLMVNLTMGFVCLLLTVFNRRQRLPLAVMVVSALALTVCLALRWMVSGTIPLSNGYETMLFMAWLIMLLTLLMQRRFSIMLTFGFLMSGFFLLVSHISQMDPQIGHLMPVLRSPLLTIHVSIIMMAFALLSLTFICSLMGLMMKRRTDELMLLSQLFLHPALTCLGFGIFIGAIWANVSWGTYWSWDPKETWALITLMVYAVGVHGQSLPWLRQPRRFHIYMVLSFLTILMTYFGVNYFLGGMHSYA